VSFTLNTTEPGPPSTIDVSDISVKSQSQWKMTVSWLVPELNGGVVETYQIYRSIDGVDFTKIASTSGTAYVDTGLSQQTYYYKVNACDIVQKCGAFTDVVDLYPTGKFTEPANLVSGPTASDVTTKKATISWGTDRASDSKVQYGTSSENYFTEEPSNSTQITAHEITLNNLSPGTTYHYKAKWTDSDGNTGESDEDSFTTEPAPTIKDVAATRVGIDTAYITLTVTGGTRIKLYYGDSAAFGFIKTTSVGTAETTELIELDELEDDTKYYFKVNGVDSDGVEYDGTTLSFTTLPRPKVSDVRVQQIVGTAQPAVLISWTSNTPVSSIVTYYPTTNPSSVLDEVSVELTAGAHQMVLRGLFPETAYSLVVSGRDKAGNEAQSDKQNFTTATDTRPPRITNMKIESSITKAVSGGNEKLAQLIVSWTTDEP
ncbi:fibronectin type III domain-containing protein, partial [Candidatus Woesebacteria bacterium]|nr:fibronectin type III domain-containing protein [Candidatus Woesebacteria bacterium]